MPDQIQGYLTGEEEMFFINYLSKEAILGTFEGNNYLYQTDVTNSFNHESFLTLNNRLYNVFANSLENDLKIKIPYYYEGIDEKNLLPYDDEFFPEVLSIKSMNSTQTINGYKCNDYEIESKAFEEVKKSTICIDEKNAINNVAIMFPQTKLKGLLIRYDAGDFNGLTIQNIANSNVKVTFDEKKEIESFTNELAKKKQEYENMMSSVDTAYAAEAAYSPDNRYEDPIVNYYNYQTSESDNVNSLFGTVASLNYSLIYNDSDYDGNPDIERSKALAAAQGSTNQLVKQFKKNKLANKSEVKELNNLFKTYFDDAKKFKLTEVSTDYDEAAVAVDSVAAMPYDLADYYDPYTSTYKTTDISKIDLAIDNPDVQDFMKVAPEHCKNLKAKIPTFTDKDLGNLVYNYAGQVCDLYIYQSGSVALSGTIDAMRKSILEINNKYDKLKKEDKDKLTTFLNSLD
ncbi:MULTISPECIES: hypothetical protein [unclassified Empedobacter]|uniref:hypothetical protein n=2 Tax=Empedobacter TaxID=59734 RepID=UPI0025BF92D9|nr:MULTISPECIES: hypothetical protein [unclassified Empedobacter]